jgi:hypothetical protein
MKERNLGDLKSSKVTMLKDLTIALSVLNATWIEMDDKIAALEDDDDLQTNPRKHTRLLTYRSKLAENEKEVTVLKAEFEYIQNPVSPSKIIPTPLVTPDGTLNDTLNMSIESDFEDNTNNIPQLTSILGAPAWIPYRKCRVLLCA